MDVITQFESHGLLFNSSILVIVAIVTVVAIDVREFVLFRSIVHFLLFTHSLHSILLSSQIPFTYLVQTIVPKRTSVSLVCQSLARLTMQTHDTL